VFLFRHSFLFARNCFAVSLSQTKNRQLQPERYAQLYFDLLEKYKNPNA